MCCEMLKHSKNLLLNFEDTCPQTLQTETGLTLPHHSLGALEIMPLSED